ncbi:drug/metabolite transporter (DMT)-like permease [Pullulanibacillus pueri]|uniref:Membrane protein n=1 Tax=Pullulanibacillus pueri TaxID=1437324 RepID=A0A8J2ZW07_9BACL|nr:DMT family transporter [Pullulanibacillus pueri]MBM7682316.1 drug/metabolite transporter (DMT)-like permease [Pullulanibacillus pueri]GGH80822.1 membrane protein [Pullulanibacillus pueri]
MKNKWVADLGLLGVAFIWGTTFVVVQDAINLIPPLSFNGWRFLAAALFLYVGFIIFSKKKRFPLKLPLLLNGVLLGSLLFIGYATQTIGLKYTSSSKVAFITGLSVVLVPFFSWIIFRHTPKWTAIIGVIFSTTGLYLLAMLKTVEVNQGDLLAFICALAFGLHIVITDRVTRSFSSAQLTMIQLLTVSLFSFLSGFFIDGFKTTISLLPFMKPMVLFACLFTALFATAVAYFLQTSLQRFTSPTHVGIIFIMEPVFAGLTATVWEHESMTLAAKIGAALIVCGMLLAEWPTKKKIKSLDS